MKTTKTIFGGLIIASLFVLQGCSQSQSPTNESSDLEVEAKAKMPTIQTSLFKRDK